MLQALGDPEGYVRSLAARALTREYADAAGLAPSAVAEQLLRAAGDKSPQVRINAIRSLGGLQGSQSFADKLAPLLDDASQTVQVQTAETLGQLGGAAAATGLARPRREGAFALRRTALVSLARVDSSAFGRAAATWRTSADWRDRAAAAEGAAIAGPGPRPRS